MLVGDRRRLRLAVKQKNFCTCAWSRFAIRDVENFIRTKLSNYAFVMAMVKKCFTPVSVVRQKCVCGEYDGIGDFWSFRVNLKKLSR